MFFGDIDERGLASARCTCRDISHMAQNPGLEPAVLAIRPGVRGQTAAQHNMDRDDGKLGVHDT